MRQSAVTYTLAGTVLFLSGVIVGGQTNQQLLQIRDSLQIRDQRLGGHSSQSGAAQIVRQDRGRATII